MQVYSEIPSRASFDNSLGNGFQWEEGPNSFQPNTVILRFLKDLHMLEELVLADPQLPRFVYFKNALHRLPMKMMDIPSFSLLSCNALLMYLFRVTNYLHSEW